MSSVQTNIAPQGDVSVAPPETPVEASEPRVITDTEVGEYREQDRYLPVRPQLYFIVLNTFAYEQLA